MTTSNVLNPTPFNVLGERGGVAHEDDGQPIRPEILPRNTLDVADRNGVHPLTVGLDVAERQSIEKHVQHLRGDGIRRLNGEWETTGQVRLRIRQLPLVHPLPLQLLELIHDYPQHFRCGFRAGIGVGHEVTTLLQRLHARPGRRR